MQFLVGAAPHHSFVCTENCLRHFQFKKKKKQTYLSISRGRQMDISVLQREVWPLAEPIVALVLRYELLGPVQPLCRPVCVFIALRRRRDAPVRASRTPFNTKARISLYPL